MLYKVYILKSELKERFYIGHTNDLIARLTRHNEGKVKSTKAYRTWKIIYTEDFENKKEAYKREMKIKSYKGGKAFKNLIRKAI